MGALIVEVRDRGPGIPSEQATRIFERFYRADGTGRDRSSGGAGLGLSIASAIVEGHGGHISAVARPGGGTIMRPLQPRHAEAPARRVAEGGGAAR
jgi:two-component system, OmpR family, sensor kinase